MADTGDPKASWSSFVRTWLGIRGWDPTRLVEQSDGALNYKTVNKWVNGAAAASADMAVVTAETLNAPAAEALRAAGHTKTATALETGWAAHGDHQSQTAGLDPGIKEILAADLLSDEEKATFVAHYQRDLDDARQQVAERSRRLVRTVEDTRRKTS